MRPHFHFSVCLYGQLKNNFILHCPFTNNICAQIIKNEEGPGMLYVRGQFMVYKKIFSHQG